VLVQGDEDGKRIANVMTQDAARVYLRFTVLFLIAGIVLGVLAAFSILLPDVFRQQPIPGYGRLTAAHRAIMIHGVIFPAVFACVYALLPRLAGVEKTVRRAGSILAWAFNLLVILGAALILVGKGSGREYSDMPQVISILLWVILIGIAIDIASIISKQKALKLNPSQGFLFLAGIFPAVAYIFTIPGWWGDGLFESTRIWVSWRAIFTGVFLSGTIGVSMWLVGLSGRRIIIPAGAFALGVGLLIIFSPFMGLVHQLDTSLWPGLKALGAFSGIMSATGLLLVIFSLWKFNSVNPPSLLLFGGLAGLAATAIQGAILLIPPVYSIFHYTANTSGHTHIALGSVLAVLLGGILVITPKISGHPLVGSEKLSGAVGLLLAGILIVFVFFSSAGVVMAMAFSRGLPSSDWMPAFRWLHAGIIAGGLVAGIGAGILGTSILQTINKRKISRLVSLETRAEEEIEHVETETEADEPVDSTPCDETSASGDDWLEGGDV